MATAWRCPHCNTNAIIASGDQYTDAKRMFTESCWGVIEYRVKSVLCPNPDCRKPTLTVSLNQSRSGAEISIWQLLPESSAMSLPAFVPEALRQDYEEACKIVDLSPKAAATLARRCLQGMIRDFWSIEGCKSLYHEIQAIKDKVDPVTWEAIDAIRGLGNIGAHMERDINLIIPVEPDEARLLIELIEDLFQTWYIQREERRVRAARVVELAYDKKAAKSVALSGEARPTAALPATDGSDRTAG